MVSCFKDTMGGGSILVRPYRDTIYNRHSDKAERSLSA